MVGEGEEHPDQQVGGDRAEDRLDVDDPPRDQVADDRRRGNEVEEAARGEEERSVEVHFSS